GGDIVERKSRRGRVFYGCANYPDCDFTLWNKPMPEKCPDCGAPFLVEKITKRHGRQLICNNEECDYSRSEELATAERRHPSKVPGATGPRQGAKGFRLALWHAGTLIMITITIIGGGLAGSEAAWQAASLGVPVVLHEMRPVQPTAVHKTDGLAELVCSNSF